MRRSDLMVFLFLALTTPKISPVEPLKKFKRGSYKDALDQVWLRYIKKSLKVVFLF